MAVRLISSAVGIAILVVVMLLSDTFLLPAVLGMVIGIILFELTRAVKGEQFKLATAGVILYGLGVTFLRFYQYLLHLHGPSGDAAEIPDDLRGSCGEKRAGP